MAESLSGGDADVELVRRLAGVFERRFQARIEDPDLDLMEQGIMDSLTFVELLVVLESDLGVEVRMDEIDFDDFRSLRSIARWVRTQGKGPV